MALACAMAICGSSLIYGQYCRANVAKLSEASRGSGAMNRSTSVRTAAASSLVGIRPATFSAAERLRCALAPLRQVKRGHQRIACDVGIDLCQVDLAHSRNSSDLQRPFHTCR